MLTALLLLTAGQSPFLISGGSGNPTGGTATLDYLTVGAIDAGVVMAGKNASASTCAVRVPNDSDIRVCMGTTNQFQLSYNGGSGASDIESSGAMRVLTGGNVNASTVQAGKFSAAAGTAAAPSISLTGDPDTGLYNVGANQLGVATAGARSFRFSAAAGTIYGASDTPFMTLDDSAGSCLNYTGAFMCVANNVVSASGSAGFNISVETPLTIGSRIVLSGATPTISSGFGTTPSVTAGYATAFRVNVGTGGTASSGVIALGATATNGWNCTCTDVTTANGTVFLCKQTANTTTTVTVTNYNTAGAAAAWVASDILAVSCVGF